MFRKHRFIPVVAGVIGLSLVCVCAAGAKPLLPNCPKYCRDNSLRYTNGADLPDPNVQANPDLSHSVEATSAFVLIDNGAESHAARREFSVLFGGMEWNDDANTPTTRGRGKLVGRDNGWTDPAWEVEAGFALARGWRPRIRTSIVTIATESTAYIVRVTRPLSDRPEAVLEVNEVILLEGGPITVSLNENGGSVTLEYPFTYVTASNIPGQDPLSRPQLIPIEDPEDEPNRPSPKLRELVNRILKMPLASAEP